MTDTGRNIVNGFRELRDFCREVALLLKTANGCMKEHNWTAGWVDYGVANAVKTGSTTSATGTSGFRVTRRTASYVLRIRGRPGRTSGPRRMS